MSTTKTTDVQTEVLTNQINDLMAEAEVIIRNMNENPDLVPDRLLAMDRVGRLAGAALKFRKARTILSEASHKHWKADRIVEEGNRILSTVSY